jgi:hypothetical protein
MKKSYMEFNIAAILMVSKRIWLYLQIGMLIVFLFLPVFFTDQAASGTFNELFQEEILSTEALYLAQSAEEEDLQKHASELEELEEEMLIAIDEKRQIEEDLKLWRDQVTIYERQIEIYLDSKANPDIRYQTPGIGIYGAARLDGAREKVADLERRLAEIEQYILILWERKDALEGSQWWKTD